MRMRTMDQVKGSQSIVFSSAPYIISTASVAGSKGRKGLWENYLI